MVYLTGVNKACEGDINLDSIEGQIENLVDPQDLDPDEAFSSYYYSQQNVDSDDVQNTAGCCCWPEKTLTKRQCLEVFMDQYFCLNKGFCCCCIEFFLKLLSLILCLRCCGFCSRSSGDGHRPDREMPVQKVDHRWNTVQAQSLRNLTVNIGGSSTSN